MAPATPTSELSEMRVAEPEDGGRRNTKLIVAGVVAVAVLLVGLAVILGGGSDKNTIRGEFTLFDAEDVEGDATDCQGTGGYRDVDAGVPVTVRNSTGDIVGSGFLEHPESNEALIQWLSESEKGGREAAEEVVERGDGIMCMLLFEIDVDDADFYEVKVGNRGESSYSRSQLDERDWHVSLSLGL